MVKHLRFLAIVPESCSKDKIVYKAYFYCRETGQLVVTKVTPLIVKRLLNINRTRYKRRYVFNLLEHLRIRKIVIKKKESFLVAQLQIGRGYKRRKFEVPFSSGFLAAHVLKIPLAIENSTLKEEGIYINEDILTNSLAIRSTDSSTEKF